MLQKFMITARPWQKILVRIIGYLLLCIFTMVFLLCIAAFMITRIDTPDYILIPITTIMLTAAAFIDSFLLGKVYKENGFITGLAIGAIFCCLIVIIAFHYNAFAFTSLFFTKIAAVISAAVLGGVTGVNT